MRDASPPSRRAAASGAGAPSPAPLPPPRARWAVAFGAVGFSAWVGLASALGAQANSGTITGRVTDAATSAPIAAAQVQIVGTNRGAQSGPDGAFAVRGVPAGNYTLRVLRIGYTEATRPAAVTGGATITVDVTMRSAPVTLAPVVTTATGTQRRVEIGNSASVVNAAQLVPSAPVANVTDMLAARTPGVQVLGGATTGSGQRIRIRGASSISLSNEPIVFVDGIRIVSDNNSASIGVGGTNPSRLSDINPEDIETFEVVRGPSAATLYGTDAANGVIVITTKRARAGAARWNAWAERGGVRDQNTYPSAYYGWTSRSPTGAASNTSNNVQCFAWQQASRLCTQDSVTAYNLWADPEATPLRTGLRQQYGANVGGGSDAARYLLSGEWEDETGQIAMPDVMAQRLREQRGISSLPRDQQYPNALRRVTLRANANAAPSPKLDFAATTAFISSSQRNAQLDNNTGGLQSNALGGPGFRGNTRPGDNVALYGFRLYPADEIFARTVNQAINRFLGSGTGNVRPTSWLSGRLTGGVDYTSRNEEDLCRRGQCVNLGILRTGQRVNNRSEFFNYTADGAATATTRPAEALQFDATAGLQYVRQYFRRNGASIENLPGGGTTLSQGATNPQVAELTSDTKTLGVYLQGRAAWRDLLFATAAVRNDRVSSVGFEVPSITYPKFDLSYIVSKERYFPAVPAITQFRLRGAFGQSGRQPGTIDALQYYEAQQYADVGGDAPALVFVALGNRNLRPEVTQEAEGGFDLQLFNTRVNLEATYYSKTTRGGLLNRPVAPSVGGPSNVLENRARVKNAGLELLLNTAVVDRPNFGLDLTINGTRNDNKLLSLGGLPTIVGTTRQQRVGYPLNGLWQRPLLGYSDADGNGVITPTEVVVGDTTVFIGREDPRTIVQFAPAVRLFRNALRLSANFDRQTGFVRLNGTDRIRCESRNNCRGLVDPAAPLREQAAAIAVREHPSRTQAGYMERADFTRLREVSASYDVPLRFVRPVRAQGATVRFGARNLRLWTNYSGIDPESNYFDGALGTVSDFQTAPPPTLYTLRLDFRF